MNGHGIGVCLIGTGRAGMIHAKNFRRNVPGAYLAAVVDVNEERAKAAAQELGIEAYFTDHKRALADRAVQAVVIVVPTNLHRQIVVDCADAGKHILCEKPMALNIEECDEMTAACGRNNVKMQIGFMRRFDESFRKAKALVDAGQIGDLD